MLTEEWPPETVHECEQEYQRARWPGRAPADFTRTLEAARVYLIFRWMGDQGDWTANSGSGPYLEQLRSVGERWGLI
jgi:hypothetical protein